MTAAQRDARIAAAKARGKLRRPMDSTPRQGVQRTRAAVFTPATVYAERCRFARRVAES